MKIILPPSSILPGDPVYMGKDGKLYSALRWSDRMKRWLCMKGVHKPFGVKTEHKEYFADASKSWTTCEWCEPSTHFCPPQP